jgi:hypothetical protein
VSGVSIRSRLGTCKVITGKVMVKLMINDLSAVGFYTMVVRHKVLVRLG